MTSENTRTTLLEGGDSGSAEDKARAAAALLNSSNDPDASHGRLTPKLLFAILACTLGSSFQFGFNIGVVNAPQFLVQDWINQTHYDASGEGLSKERVDFIWSVAVSIFCVGGMVGGLISGFVADRFGRRGGMLINNFFALVAAALLGFSKLSGSYYLVILGRLVVGFNSGVNSGLAPMYLTEISPVNLRGAVGSVHQLVVTISILISQIFGLKYLLGTADLWPLLFALVAFPAIFQLVTLPLCPESPKYSLITKGRDEQAEKDLRSLRGKENVSPEMNSLRAEDAKLKAEPQVKFGDMFRLGELRWPLFIAVMMMLSQQLSGINVAMYYSTQVFTDAGLTQDEAVYATLGMGTINVIMTVVSVLLVERAGRRTLHLVGLGGMWVTSILIVIMLVLQSEGYHWASALCVVLVLLFVVAFATGPGSIPWFYVSELFTTGARGNANSVAVCANWSANFFVGLIFLPLNTAIQQYSFLLFTFFLTIFWLFTWKFVPETKGVPLDTIVQRFKDRAAGVSTHGAKIA